MSAFATRSLETTFTTDTHCSADLEEVIRVATGEGKNPASVLIDTYCEEIAYPHLFPSGKYCYKVQGDIPLSAKKHFSQRLIIQIIQYSNYSQVFPADSDIFFSHSVMQKVQLKSLINPFQGV